jgi:DNA-binding response OmpR family regulator
MDPRRTRSTTRVLVVEDDATVSEVVTRYLEREGFSVETAADGHEALDRALTEPPDLMVLDIMLPGLDGLEVCRRVRAKAPIPIIMLTALGEENDRVVGLDLGADDYITKPFSPRELTSRIKSVLRRARGPLAGSVTELRAPLTAGDVEVDIAAREVRVKGREISITAREFELLVFLMLRPNQVFTREDLLQHVWGYSFGDTSTVTVHVRRLREKIESDPAHPNLIKTIWGVGYKFEQTPSEE